jgi:Uma2 family endonuclease
MKRRATYEDLMQVPDHLVAEIIDGELFTSPRPATPHAWASSVLIRDLVPFDQRPSGPGGPGGWWIIFEPELHFGEDVLVPDLAGWRHERMRTVPSSAFITLGPDWVCEVVSPSTGRLDRSLKMNVYAREGVRHLWLIDPIARTLEAYRLSDDRWIVGAVRGSDDVVRIEPFDAVELALDRWWLKSADPRTPVAAR